MYSALFFWTSSFLFTLGVMVISVICFLLCSEGSFLFSIYMMETTYDSFMVVDFLSLTFVMVVSIVSSAVIFYSVEYMDNSTMKVKFIVTLVLFIISMFILSFSSDLFWVMIGWDGLGLSSLGLIMYFQNWKSFNSSMTTFLSNRLGDALLLLSLVWFLGLGCSKSLSSPVISLAFLSFMIFGAFSKSAQIPFSAWLPLAMAAPTPVSSLVHSSTLVTAGVYLLLRFKNFLPKEGSGVIFYISGLTILLSASSSMGECDLKKVIALSTLSHVGLMIMFISLSSFLSAMIHLYSHAMFKSLLFMVAGDLIHKNSNSQDLRRVSISVMDYPTGTVLVISLLSMVGFPFMSGFYSKELFLMVVSGEDLIKGIVFFVAATLTSSYSLRILYSLMSNESESSSSITYSPNWKVFFTMSIFSLLTGGFIASISKGVEVVELQLSSLLFMMKSIIFLFIAFGGLIGLLVCLTRGGVKPILLRWVHNMWWVSSICYVLQSSLYSISWKGFFKCDSKGTLDTFMTMKKSLSVEISKTLYSVLVPFPIMMVGLSAILLISLLGVV